jgi:hypothetical protein
VCVLLQGGIGINVAQMIVELIRDKRKIVDRITHSQIDQFVALLQTSQVFNPFTASCENAMSLSVPGVQAPCEKFSHSSQLNFE